jgi:hypothetical protein
MDIFDVICYVDFTLQGRGLRVSPVTVGQEDIERFGAGLHYVTGHCAAESVPWRGTLFEHLRELVVA